MSKYECHCILHVYDGIRTTVTRMTIQVEAESEREAERKVCSDTKQRYKHRTDCGLSSIVITSTKKIEELEDREQELKNLLHQILGHTSKAKAYTDAAHIHHWIRSKLRSMYGEEV
ncbi:hypothetical protein [Paenibacillus alvei]|uniref:hypothetical protein n=1 Tax=Paenibacillus alvei TaxID=44250 RepID=UPI0018CDA10B|nr:hypothetical protein [Paenibacillus alvei]MBG9734566.1 hypothetical protein [Paenibacillus alvei]MBG9743123.1 hypothetical protein [Paenibacillus alvei]MCY9579574.1 hypothetical protein [Paenibacillus alvei]MCY9586534.1 hypothetical protein [Paenibacillus alvei]